MKKRIAMLLALALTLSLWGCTREPAPTTEPTQPSTQATEPTPPPTQATEPAGPTAAEQYTQAVTRLENAQVLQLKINIVDSRTVGGMDFVLKSTEDVILQPEGSLWQAYRKQWLSRGAVTEEFTEYFDGKKLHLLSTGLYSRPDWEEYLAILTPVAMFAPENYGSVTEIDGTITFADALAAEAWALPEGAELVAAQGEAELDSGNLVRSSYTLRYTLAGVTGTYQVELEVVGVDKDADPIPETQPEDEEKVDSLEAVKLLSLGLAAVVESDSLSVSAEHLIQVQAGGLLYFLSGYYDVCGEDSHMSANLEMLEGEEETRMTQEETYIDGKLEYYMDDEHQGTYRLSPDRVIGVYEESWTVCLPQLEQLADLSLEDQGDFWMIEFKGTDAWGKELQQKTCGDLFQNSAILDDLATTYRTNNLEGVLYIDKYTLLPTGYYTEYLGTHTIEGRGYRISRDTSVSFDFTSGDAYEEIYGEPAPVAEPENKATPLFYEVTDPDGQVMYLLGTIHLGDERTAYLPQQILDAFASSDALAVEVDLDETERLVEEDPDFAAAVGESYYYSDGSQTSDHLTDEVYEQAAQLLAQVGGWNTYTTMMRPMLWQQLLTERYTALDGRLDYAMGVDNRLMHMAKTQGKKVYSIEDQLEHTALLGSFSDEIQSAFLEDMLDVSRAEYMQDVVELFEMWCRGDAEELLPAMEDDVSELTPEELELYNEYNQAMMIDRNAIMVEKAIEYLESGETVFYAVGCAHLAGETGLLHCLEQAGYTITQVSYE